jgi:hypothetical protein
MPTQSRATIHAARALALAYLIVGFLSGTATAQSQPLGDISGVVVVGPVLGDGDPSVLDQGLGKLRAGEDRLSITADATIVWAGDLSERIRAVASIDMGSDNQPVLGLGELYLKFRPDLVDAWKVSGRAGQFFPPVSLEHDGADWSLSRTLTPSAVNTWIAEEVKTIGVEASLRGAIGDQPVSFTAAAFAGNDTSGALLAFRGWALHDVRATVGGTFALPEMPAMFEGTQAARTRPVDEVDGRIGGYGQFEWAPSDTLSVSLFAYDNNGDETSLEDGHYAWRTRFAQAALHWDVYEGAEILVQAMTGETRMGGRVGGQSPANVGFIAAYGLLSQNLWIGTATVRLDYFAVSDRSFKDLDNNAENGWSASLAWVQPVRDRTDLVLEGIVASSERPDRMRFGLNRDQTSAQARVALRTGF